MRHDILMQQIMFRSSEGVLLQYRCKLTLNPSSGMHELALILWMAACSCIAGYILYATQLLSNTVLYGSVS